MFWLYRLLRQREPKTCDALRNLVPSVYCKKRENIHGGVLLKVTLLHGCFSRFLNCINGIKSCKASHNLKLKKYSLQLRYKHHVLLCTFYIMWSVVCNLFLIFFVCLFAVVISLSFHKNISVSRVFLCAIYRGQKRDKTHISDKLKICFVQCVLKRLDYGGECVLNNSPWKLGY